MNNTYIPESQMLAMPYVFPSVVKPAVSKSLLNEVLSIICIIYTLVIIIFYFNDMMKDPAGFYYVMLLVVLRITFLVAYVVRDCDGKDRATGLLALIAYFDLAVNLILVIVASEYLLFIIFVYRTLDPKIVGLLLGILADFGLMFHLVINGAICPCDAKRNRERYISVPY